MNGRATGRSVNRLSVLRIGLALLCLALLALGAAGSALVGIGTVGVHQVSALTELTIGVPVSDNMETTGDTNYYQISVGAGETLSIILDGSVSASYVGNQIYVRYGDLPTTSVYDFVGILPVGSPDQAVLIPSTVAGTYYVLAYCTGYNSCCGPYGYTITVHSSSTLPTLVTGVSADDQMQTKGDTNWYQVVVDAGETLSVVLDASVSASYVGNQIYVRYGELPTTSEYDFAGTLPEGSPDQAVMIPTTLAGTYYILAYCTGYNSCCGPYGYTITVHSSSTFPTVEAGVSADDQMQTVGDANWYQVAVGAGQTLSIVLDASVSASYVGNQVYVRYGDLPTTSEYDFVGMLPEGSPDQAVLIPDTLAGTYYILAYCTGYNSCCGPYGYNITVHTGSTFPTLGAGMSVDDQMQTKGDANWYQVVVDAGETLSVVLDASVSASYVGNQIYVRYGELPSTSVYDFVGGLSGSPDQAVLISSTLAGTYYILAYCTGYNSCCGPYGYTITSSAGLGGSNSPGQPTNVSPGDTTTDVSRTPNLEASAFSDPNVGDTHTASQWQITAVAGNYVTPVFNSLADGSNLTSINIPSSVLAAGTTYYWRVRYRDNNFVWSAWSPETSFTTSGDATGPVISGVAATAVTAAAATITWDTDEAASSQVEFGPTASYGSSTTIDLNLTTSHSVNLTGLSPQTTYHYRVRSTDDSGNETNSADYTFLTASDGGNQPPTAPVNGSPSDSATGVDVAPALESSDFSDPDAGDTQAAAQWQVTRTPGDYSQPVYDSGSDSTNLTEIDVPAGALAGSTTYYWRVRYQDSSGNWSAWSAESAFVTAGAPAPAEEDKSLIRSVPLPSEVFQDPKTSAATGAFAIIFVLAFYFSASLFNSTLRENYAVIGGWRGRISVSLNAIDRYVGKKTSGIRLASGKINVYLRAAVIVIVSALLYSFIDPTFGFNAGGLAIFLALVVSVGIVTAAYEGVQVAVMARRFSIPAGFRLYWVAILIAAVCVVTSLAVDFHPGIIYGFVGAATILSVKPSEKRQEAIAILIGGAVLLASVACAFLLRELPPSNNDERFWALLVNGILVGTFVMGLEGLLFALLPLPFMDGGKVAAWKKWVAIVALTVVVFFFVGILIVGDKKSLGEAAKDVKVLAMAGLMPLCLLVSGGFWLYFMLRGGRVGREEAAPAPAPGGAAGGAAVSPAGEGAGLARTLEELAQSIFSELEKKDPRTASHQRRVMDLARAIAAEMGLSGEQSQAVRLAGMLHDVGNMRISTDILSKPGRLTDGELKAIRRHPRSGSQMLKKRQVPESIADIVAQHHERLDGSGYPLGLKGEQSNLGARILAVADVVAAMTSDKPYRPAFSVEQALEEIIGKKGKLYDTGVVDACLAVFNKGSFRFAEQAA